MQYYVFDNYGIASIHTQMYNDAEDYPNNLKEEIANSEVGFTMIDSLQKMNFFKRKHGRDYKQKGHITLKCLYLNTVTRQRWALPLIGVQQDLIIIAAINSATNAEMFNSLETGREFLEKNKMAEFQTIYDIQASPMWNKIKTGVMYSTMFLNMPADIFVACKYQKKTHDKSIDLIQELRASLKRNPTTKEFDNAFKYGIKNDDDIEQLYCDIDDLIREQVDASNLDDAFANNNVDYLNNICDEQLYYHSDKFEDDALFELFNDNGLE